MSQFIAVSDLQLVHHASTDSAAPQHVEPFASKGVFTNDFLSQLTHMPHLVKADVCASLSEHSPPISSGNLYTSWSGTMWIKNAILCNIKICVSSLHWNFLLSFCSFLRNGGY